MKTPHTATYPNKKVYVRLRDGREFIDRFVDRTDRFVILKHRGKVYKRDIQSFTIYRPNSNVAKHLNDNV